MRIGGHLGMDVERLGGGVVRKSALHVLDNGSMTGAVGVDLYDHNVTALKNEARILKVMDGLGIAPRLITEGDGYIDQEDLGDQEPPTNMEAWRQNCARVVGRIRASGVRHGDMKGNNIITKNNWPWVVDWQESHLLGEVAPQKSPYTDSYLMFSNVKNMPGPNGQHDTPRVARRWLAVLGALGAIKHSGFHLPLFGQTFCDLGCFQGDFVALAAAEGMLARGVDRGGFRTGEDSIMIGNELWKGYPFGHIDLWNMEVMHLPHFQYDVVMMFSTWPYIVIEFGRELAEKLLAKIMGDCGIMFFETQLQGDGPGPDFLQTDGDVKDLLVQYGRVEHLVRIPVTGRPAERSVWMVTPR